MKARMKDNLILKYQLCPEFNYRDKHHLWNEQNELLAGKKLFGMEGYFKTKEFLKSIEGKVVDLVFLGDDAFEKNDNNHLLPDSLWDAI